MDLLTLVTTSRVLHVLGAMVLFGGAFFVRYLLLPAAEKLPESDHTNLKEDINKKWRQIVGAVIGILIFTGFYNYLVVMAPQHKGDKIYHMMMGMKILLAFVVFFYASVLPGRSPKFANIRKNARFWMTLNLLIATVVIGIAGFLKVRGVPVPPPPQIPVGVQTIESPLQATGAESVNQAPVSVE